jgi:hypothetical protein
MTFFGPFSMTKRRSRILMATNQKDGNQETVEPRLPQNTADMPSTDQTLDSLWTHCTARNRLVPMPAQWSTLYGMLKNTRQKPSGGWEPPLPLILAAWDGSMPIEKQLRFKEHLHWAEAQKQLPEISAFLLSLPEEQWCHLGET